MRSWRKSGSILIFTLMAAWAGACATPPAQPPGTSYYLTANLTYLRDAASYDGNVVGQLYQNDQVEGLEIGASGWWRVRSGRTGQTGWLPGELLSPTPVAVAYLFVTKTVNLRECPKESCPSLQLLSRGDQVQKIEENAQGWRRVLVAGSRNLGWLPAQVLAESLEQAQAKGPYYYVRGASLEALSAAAVGGRSGQTAAG